MKLQAFYTNKKWLYEQYIEKVLSQKQIAKLCGVSQATIQHYLIKFDIPIRTLAEAAKVSTVENRGRFKKGDSPWCKDKSVKHPNNCRCPFCKAHRGELIGEEHPMFGKNHSKVSIEKISRNRKGKGFLSEETKKQFSIAWSGKNNPAKNLITRMKLKELAKKRWQDPNYIRKQMKAKGVKPNKTEQKLSDLLQFLFPKEYKYVGDGQLIIAGKCPDFAHTNGKRKLIELFGTYWHRGETGEERKELFSEYGYQTLIVWERELQDIPRLSHKLMQFNEK